MAKKLGVTLVLIIILFAFTNKNKREVIYTNLAPTPIGPYSQAIKSNGTLYVAGQIGIKVDGSFDSTSIENECTQVLNNIKAIVEAGGLNMNAVSKSTIYLTDLKNFTKVNEIYKTYFPINPPARETIEVKALPKGAHIEISVIAN
ncbi:MAG: Rid family detoxifying hydrolase [Bacteroidota bacterium]|nr:Rid family detoxifying hydrolase [Bacteroidota bacterium]MDP3143947.1 Rid family detoxifying hydrolase [Bacteroidota bacterium]MDP3557554.1 Rid family detoxifying hydrolase [Bacteroidota bacterium]